MNIFNRKSIFLFLVLFISAHAYAQNSANVSARIDAAKITVGDQVHLFIEAHNNEKQGRLQWAVIPDTFNNLEVVERGKIDTLKQGDLTTYKQRILVTGFDSGVFKIPAFQFAVIPAAGTPYTIQTDSFLLSVQTVAVDTTQPFKGIKGIILVKSTWRDYIWYILGGIVFIALLIFVIYYFLKNKKVQMLPARPKESLQAMALRLLAELEQKQLWQHNQVKEYYIELTDIVRYYIEKRFKTPALELTTDELLHSAMMNKEMQPYREVLSGILYTADLAKFAKAQPTPLEHTATMESARQFINVTKPAITETTTPAQS